MLSLTCLILFVAVAFSKPIAPRGVLDPTTFTQIIPSKNLTWHPCLTSWYCAVLDVPLDYANPNGTRAYVPLLKYPASKTPYAGMVLTNPGGSGESAIDNVYGYGSIISQIVGSNYDLVAWEPRAIGYSVPLANCSATSAAIKRRGGALEDLLAKVDKFTGPLIPQQLFEEQYQAGQALGEKCVPTMGGPNDAGPHMTTSVVVKDIISIVDAYKNSPYSAGVQNPFLVNFWGFSYGTFIGQTLASMYPSRIGRVVLDGVVDLEDYASGAALKDLQTTDEAFSTFFVYCNLASPALCPYSTNTTAQDIHNRFERTLARLNATEAIEKNWANATDIAYALEATKIISREITYQPISGFPALAQILLYVEAAVQNNITIDQIIGLQNYVGYPVSLTDPTTPTEWLAGIFCSDNGNALYNKTLAELQPKYSALEKQSYIGGEVWGITLTTCTGWGIQGVERFAGPFGGKTKNPILFVSNTWDPVTPLANGQKGTRLFPDSKLLTIQAAGHTSAAANNQCANGKINQFFQTGKLIGNSCKAEAGPWGVTIHA